MPWVQTLLPLVISLVTVVGGGGLVKVLWIDKAISRTQEQLNSATAKKTATEGEVGLSGSTLEWAREFRAATAAAEEKAAAAATRAKAAEERLDEMEDETRKLRVDYDDLLRRILECQAGAICPLVISVRESHS